MGIAAEQSAEKWEKLNRATAKAAGLTTAAPEMQALMRAEQQARMSTGIGGEVFTTAATGLIQGGVSIKEATEGAAESTGIWAAKWKTDADSVARSMTELGNRVKPVTQTWKEFIDQQGTVLDTLAAKTGTSASAIMAGMNKVAPIMSILKVPADAVPSWEALIAVMTRAGIAPERVGKGIQAAVQAMTGAKAPDFAKLLGLDTAQFEAQMQKDVIGTLQKVATAIQELPIQQQIELLKELGGGKDIISLMGDPAKAEQLTRALNDATTAANSGKTAQTAWATSLKDAGTQIDRIKESLQVMLERLGTPLVGTFAGALSSVADFTQTLVNLGTVIYSDVIAPSMKIVDTINQNPILKALFGGLGAGVAASTNPLAFAGKLINEEAARLEGGKTADAIGSGIEANKDKIIDPITGALVDAGTEGGKSAGEIAAEEFAKAQDNFWKSYGSALAAGYMAAGTWDAAGNFTAALDEKGKQIYKKLQSTESYGPTAYGKTLTLQSKVPISFSEMFDTNTPGATYYLRIADKVYSTGAQFAMTRAEAIPQLLAMANKDLNADVSQFFGPEGEALFSGAIDQATYDARVAVRENLTVDLSTMFRDVIVDPDKYLESQLAKIGDEAGNALKDGIVTVQEQVTIRELIDAYAAAGGNASDALIQALLNKDWAAVGTILGQETGEGFITTLGALIDPAKIAAQKLLTSSEFWSKTASERDALIKQYVGDTHVWFSGFLSQEASYNEQLISQGLKASTESWDRARTLFTENSSWFTREQAAYMEAMDQFISYVGGIANVPNTIWNKFWQGISGEETTNQLQNNLNKATVGYDQLKATIQDCADCAVSDFEKWQEAQAGLFSGAYLGEGGAAYEAWETGRIQAIANVQEAMQRTGGIVVGKDYTQLAEELSKQTVTIEANTTPMETAVQDAKTKTEGVPIKIEIDANTDPLFSVVNSAIAAIASQTITIPVYGVYQGETGYAGTTAMEMVSSSAWTGFQEGTDYVPRTGPYILHRGEQVIPAGQHSGDVTINMGDITIEGPIYGVDDIDERIARAQAEQAKTFKEALKTMAKAQ